jgi:hypothetical protein
MTLSEVWKAWNVGEITEGPIPGQKPPRRLVEQYIKAKWWSTAKVKKLFDLDYIRLTYSSRGNFGSAFEKSPNINGLRPKRASIHKSPEASTDELEAVRNYTNPPRDELSGETFGQAAQGDCTLL